MAEPAPTSAAPKAPTSPARAAAHPRSLARLAAVQALYQMDFSGTGVKSVAAEFEAHRFGEEIDGVSFAKPDRRHFRRVIEAAVERQREIDRAIADALRDDWPLERIDGAVRALMRAAAAELVACADVPPKSVINEYVEIAKAFFDGDEPRLVNAVTDRLARAQGLIPPTPPR